MVRTKKQKKLNDKQKRFAAEYLIDLNATQAAKRAGYSEKTSYAQGHYLLKHPEVKAEIQRNMDERAKRTEITADNVLKEIAKMAFCNVRDVFDENGNLRPIHDLPETVTASISSVKVKTFTLPGAQGAEVEHVTEVKLWDKGANLERLGKHLKIFTDNLNVSGSMNITMDETDLKA